MRRSARGEQSTFSLFPFLAVLLCTMGAMVVLLVAMAHVSREKAAEEAQAAKAVAEAAELALDSPERRELERRLAEVEQVAEQIRKLREEGDKRLTQEQNRLSDIEDHLRRLRDEAESLQVEAQELFAVEDEHYDDEKIAQQELKRLNELANELEDEIEELKHAATGRERKFAVVALRDKATGTLRPPAYFECTESGIVLQPEGIKLSLRDLVAPKYSSPVGAASRAITRYYEEHPEARAANEVGKPYPLLVVRPGGVDAYYRARTALEMAGIDYGYQPVGDDWPMEYGEPNPVLMQWVAEAVASAQAEREGLAAAIPPLAAAMEQAEYSATGAIAGGGSFGGANSLDAEDPGIRVSQADPDANNPFEGLRIEGSLPGESDGSNSLAESGAGQGGGPGVFSPFDTVAPRQAPQGPSGPYADSQEAYNGPAGVAATAAPTQETTDEPNRYTEPESTGTRNGVAAAGSTESSRNATAAANGSPNQDRTAQGQPAAALAANAPPDAAGNTGAGNSNRRAPQRDGVPMVRPIRLYVAADRVVVLPDRAQSPATAAAQASQAQVVLFNGRTSDNVNELIGVLRQHADSWGIAGLGMYWDPRLMLNVASDGQDRADDLRRLLEAAGLKVQARPSTTAVNPAGGNDATRR
ncbi:MAG: hypothetical protein AAF266_11435 [Planctomycetota bacterium]